MKSLFKFSMGAGCVGLILVLLLSGCSTRIIDFTIISSKQMDMRVKDTGKANRVTGKDVDYLILFIPTGTPNLKEAVDNTIEAAGPGYDALIDGVIYYEQYWFVLVTQLGYKVEGTPIKTSELEANLLREGKDTNLAMQNVLYHSSLGISNEEAIENIGIVHADKD